MKISLEWLEQYLPGAAQVGAEKAAEALMNGGLPVETIETVGADTVMDVEVTSNRSDCLSHMGVARELGALLGKDSLGVAPQLKESKTGVTSVKIEAGELCSFYSARVIKGVKIGPSPAWLVRRLEAIGVRAINNVVDVTNYVMFELGQPLHAFDFDKLEGGRIVVRRALGGERLVSIDGKTRDLNEQMLVIADARRAVALAGVMGGKETEVSEGTVNVLLESARFDPLCVRKTSRGLALRSDSSYRFERGIDPAMAELASRRAAELIIATAGGEVVDEQHAGSDALTAKRLSLRVGRIAEVLGVEVSGGEAMLALARLGFSPVLKGEVIECSVPSWRLDVSIEVDLVEEVARVIGYGRIPVRKTIEVLVTPPQQDLAAIEQVRGALVACGYFEALTFSWVSDSLRDDLRPAQANDLLRAGESVRKDNAHLRPSMIPGLLEAVRRNETVGNGTVKLFEMGSTFWVGETGQVDERRRLALAGTGDYREVRGAVEAVLEAINAKKQVRVVAEEQRGLAKGACGRIEWDGMAIGTIGKMETAIVGKLGLTFVPVVAEIELAPLIEAFDRLPQVSELAKFPAMKRDLSLVVGEQVAYEQIERAVSELKLPQLESLEYVTTYRGKQIGEGKKSITIALVFRSESKTLTSEEVEGSVQKAVGAVKEKVGAELRV